MLPHCDFQFGAVPVVYASRYNILESAVRPAGFKADVAGGCSGQNKSFQGILMKRILIVIALSAALVPQIAWAELSYSSVDLGYLVTSYSPSLTEMSIAVSKGIPGNFYLDASYSSGSQVTNTYQGENHASAITLGGGYHAPLHENVDGIVKGDVILGSVTTAGNSTSEDGFDIAAGIRAQMTHRFEGTLAAVYASTSGGIYASSDIFVNAQLGFNFTPNLQLNASVDFRPTLVSGLRLRYFY
jgi:hypothetical protein